MEIYSVDLCSKTNQIIYGTNKDFGELYDFVNDKSIVQARDFNDSVIFTKIIDENTYLFVSLDGTIILMKSDGEKYCLEIGEDISTVYFNNKLIIGTCSGRVYMYTADLYHLNTYHSHASEILSVFYNEPNVMSLDASKFTCSDSYGRILYQQRFQKAVSMCHIAADVYCVASFQKIDIFRREERLFSTKIEEAVNSIVFLEKDIVIGGDFTYLLLININGYAMYRLNVDEMVTKIIKLTNNQIGFATFDGKIGIMDIRNIKTLKYYHCGVGTIFDFKKENDTIVVGGEGGVKVFDLNKSEYACEYLLANDYYDISNDESCSDENLVNEEFVDYYELSKNLQEEDNPDDSDYTSNPLW